MLALFLDNVVMSDAFCEVPRQPNTTGTNSPPANRVPAAMERHAPTPIHSRDRSTLRCVSISDKICTFSGSGAPLNVLQTNEIASESRYLQHLRVWTIMGPFIDFRNFREKREKNYGGGS